MSRDVYIFIGPPGSGKGSLSALCVNQLGWVQLSTGNLCRQHIAEQTSIGKAIDFAIKSGKLVADDLITDMVLDWFEKQSIWQIKPIILDGYPRTVTQAQAFHKALQDTLHGFNVQVVLFDVDDKTVAERIQGRYVCQNKNCQAVYSLIPGALEQPKVAMICDHCSSSLIRRKDDEGSAIYERLAVYHSHVNSLIDFYRKAGVPIRTIDAHMPVHELFDTFKKYALCEVA